MIRFRTLSVLRSLSLYTYLYIYTYTHSTCDVTWDISHRLRSSVYVAMSFMRKQYRSRYRWNSVWRNRTVHAYADFLVEGGILDPKDVKCDVCLKHKPPEEFSTSALHNRATESQQTRCLDCSNPPCTVEGCTTCKICRDVHCKGGEECKKETATLNSKYLPKTLEELANFRCEKCRGFFCEICRNEKPRSEFGEGAKKNSSSLEQKTRCLDCSNPPCTMEGCTTCKLCRDAKCTDPNRCGKKPRTLNSMLLPMNKEALAKFLCENCKFPPCCGTNCKTKPNPKMRERLSQQVRAGTWEFGKPWKCPECRNEEFKRQRV